MDVVAISGFSVLSGTLLANIGLALAVLEPWEERMAPEEQLDALLARLRGALAAIPMAEAAAFAPPAIPTPQIGQVILRPCRRQLAFSWSAPGAPSWPKRPG